MKKNQLFLRRQPQQKRSQERVEQILDAAAEIFDEVGFEAATTHTIAKRANTAVGSLYQFFPDKQAIFNALELRHIDRVYAMWERLLQPKVIQLPFKRLIGEIGCEFRQLFGQASSRIVFVQYFTSNVMFKNIDDSFTKEAIQVMSQLLQERNPSLDNKKSDLLAEVCVHTMNTLLLVALRSNDAHRQEIFREIETVIMTYLQSHIGDEILSYQDENIFLKQLKDNYQLNSRQYLALIHTLNESLLTISIYHQLCSGVSRRTLQRDLQKMLQQGLFICEGKTNQLIYYINPTIRQTYDNLKQKKSI